jgi:hypothetical protein
MLWLPWTDCNRVNRLGDCTDGLVDRKLSSGADTAALALFRLTDGAVFNIAMYLESSADGWLRLQKSLVLQILPLILRYRTRATVPATLLLGGCGPAATCTE